MFYTPFLHYCSEGENIDSHYGIRWKYMRKKRCIQFTLYINFAMHFTTKNCSFKRTFSNYILLEQLHIIAFNDILLFK